jgi:ATP-binding protein involved in chromosome partitioning
MLNSDNILAALKSVKYPGYSRDIVSFGLVKNVAYDVGAVKVQLQLTTAHPEPSKSSSSSPSHTLRSQTACGRSVNGFLGKCLV